MFNTTALSLLDCDEHILATRMVTCQEVMDIGDFTADHYRLDPGGFLLVTAGHEWTRCGYLRTSISGQGLCICQTWHSTESRSPMMQTQPCRQLCGGFRQPSPFQWKSFTKIEILKEPFYLVPFGIFQTAAAVGVYICLSDLSPILLILSFLILMVIRSLPELQYPFH